MPRKANAPLPQPLFSEPVFNEGVATPDPTVFKQPHPSDTNTYNQVQNLLKKDVVSFSAPRGKPGDVYTLESALGAHGPAVVQEIQGAGQIVFHAAGDTGASNVRKYGNEISVADVLTNDFHTSAAGNRPAFFYHLGDVVYDFGESQYYYDQFYEPFRNYPAPIFAIPGNHDSFVIPNTPAANTPLSIFTRNFCAAKPVITKEAASLHRTAMTQPGVYFTLDAPFVRIIGLFSNALEDPGVISNLDHKWDVVSNLQIDFLRAQLKRIKQENYPGAFLLATHHPAYSYSPPTKSGGAGGNHGCSTVMLQQIDKICEKEGVYTHAFLSGHAHNYQRYTRIFDFGGKEIDVPFIVCGDGGHNVNTLVRPRKGTPAIEPLMSADVKYLEGKNSVEKVKHLILAKYDDRNYGYLRIHVDKQYLKIGFHQVGVRSLAQSRFDMVTVRLADRHLVAN